jgi:hypothetical protein
VDTGGGWRPGSRLRRYAQREVIEGSVTLYSPNEPQLARPPAEYEFVGDIEVTELVDTPSDDIPESILCLVRSRASSMGANGVLIDGISSMAVATRRDGGEPTVVHRKLPMTITGKAIRVPKSN